MQGYGYRQEVTGLVVNEKVNVRRRYVKDIRRWLYLWERYGYKKAAAIFKKDYGQDKGHVKNTDALFESVLAGKLMYMQMVKGADDSTYRKLRKRYNTLMQVDEKLADAAAQEGSEGMDDLIIETMMNKGLDEAMKLFEQNDKDYGE